jgi:hypothetical protein
MRLRPKPEYPNVRCAWGHPDQPGYAVCTHVVNGDPTASVSRPTPTKLGSVCCNRPAGEHKSADLILCCAPCAERRGYLTIAALPQAENLPPLANGGLSPTHPQHKKESS